MSLDVVDKWKSGDTVPDEVFHTHQGDGEGAFIHDFGVERTFPDMPMFRNDYIGPILIDMMISSNGHNVERREFISYTRNEERLAALSFLFRHGFIRVMFLSDCKFYFTLTGLGKKIASICVAVYFGEDSDVYRRFAA